MILDFRLRIADLAILKGTGIIWVAKRGIHDIAPCGTDLQF
jgi:hypothetical protein